jgi:hypothetical protein
MPTTFLIRRDVALDWATKNPRLREGEMGLELGTNRFKMGDGVRNWLDLPYFEDGDAIKAYIDAEIAGLAGNVTGVSLTEFTNHVDEEVAPHPNYDDGRSLILLYENAKV